MPLVPKSRISQLREKAGLTQAQIAALIGVTSNTIQNWEKPNGIKQLDRYLKMAKLLRCQVEDFVEYVWVEPDEIETSKSKAFTMDQIQNIQKEWGYTEETEDRTTNSNETKGQAIQ